MLIEDISASQIFTAVLFLTALFAAQIYIFKNKNTLKEKWSANKRIHLSDSTRLGPAEKLQIIRVDNVEFLYFFSKGNQPVIIPMTVDNDTNTQTTRGLQAHQKQETKKRNNPNKVRGKSSEKSLPTADKKLIQAISLARKQNPNISFE